jgi:mannan endo-1,4-beta-mannosidase
MKAIICLLFSVLLFACKKGSDRSKVNNSSSYHIVGKAIYYQDKPIQLIGSNALHVFGAGSSDMLSWQIDIVREFIGNVKETPISGGVIKDAVNTYLYALQTIVDSNRLNHQVTILCPFKWDTTANTDFTGKWPSNTSWWTAYKQTLAQWAMYFKNQPDVWLEVWNEPYRYDRTDGYNDDIWLTHMNELVGIVRNTGNNNIVVVPCAEQGQDESVLLANGQMLKTHYADILFDIHAYEKWLLASNTAIGSRLQQLQQQNIPVIFGETAPMNAGVLMQPASFLDSIYTRGMSVCAWLWKYDENDQAALLTTTGKPNNNNNHQWGTLYNTLCLKPRKP